MVAILAVLGAIGLLLATCGPPGKAPTGRALWFRPPDAIATSTGPFQAGPVPPPPDGALLGAWVRPDSLSQQGRITAVHQFEQDLGRRLDIVNTYRRFDDAFPTRSDRAFAGEGATLMLSWVIDDTRAVASGALDPQIRDWAQRMASLDAPILLRFRWEMDRPNLAGAMWSAPDYVAAWRHVHAIFAAARVPNVSWVWCPTAEGFAGGYAQPFYPGDDEVDWVCVDVYAGNRLTPLGGLLRPFLTWAAAHPKPIVIGEFGVARAWGAAAQAGWLADASRLFQVNPQIKAVCYFDSDPDGNAPNQQFQLSGPPLRAFADLAHSRYFNPLGR